MRQEWAVFKERCGHLRGFHTLVGADIPDVVQGVTWPKTEP